VNLDLLQERSTRRRQANEPGRRGRIVEAATHSAGGSNATCTTAQQHLVALA
jgi:hypothetical protein